MNLTPELNISLSSMQTPRAGLIKAGLYTSHFDIWMYFSRFLYIVSPHREFRDKNGNYPTYTNLPSYHGRINMWREDNFVLILLQNKSNQHFLPTMSFFLDKFFLATGGYDGSIPLFLTFTPQAIWSSLHLEETKNRISFWFF